MDLHFPSYEEVLEQGKQGECSYVLFGVYQHVYCRFTYMEDGWNGFHLDVMCENFVDKFWPKHYFPGTRDGYDALQNCARAIRAEILANLLNPDQGWE